MSQKARFEFNLTYFKDSGKYYSDGVIELEVETTCDGKSPYMPEACDKIREMANKQGSKPLPGLSGVWTGPILLNCEDGFPCLLLPK